MVNTMNANFLNSDHADQINSLVVGVPALLTTVSPLAENLSVLMDAIGTDIESDEELKERMNLIDTFYGYVEQETDIAAKFAELIAIRVHEYEVKTVKLPVIQAGEALDYFIKVRELKQSDLSEVATQSTVSAIIAGKRKMTLDQVKGFANFFNVPSTMFMG